MQQKMFFFPSSHTWIDPDLCPLIVQSGLNFIKPGSVSMQQKSDSAFALVSQDDQQVSRESEHSPVSAAKHEHIWVFAEYVKSSLDSKAAFEAF